MTVKISEVIEPSNLTGLWGTPEWKTQLEARQAHDDEEALTYLREKFPGIEESAFFTDYRGNISKHVSEPEQ